MQASHTPKDGAGGRGCEVGREEPPKCEEEREAEVRVTVTARLGNDAGGGADDPAHTARRGCLDAGRGDERQGIAREHGRGAVLAGCTKARQPRVANRQVERRNRQHKRLDRKYHAAILDGWRW